MTGINTIRILPSVAGTMKTESILKTKLRTQAWHSRDKRLAKISVSNPRNIAREQADPSIANTIRSATLVRFADTGTLDIAGGSSASQNQGEERDNGRERTTIPAQSIRTYIC